MPVVHLRLNASMGKILVEGQKCMANVIVAADVKYRSFWVRAVMFRSGVYNDWENTWLRSVGTKHVAHVLQYEDFSWLRGSTLLFIKRYPKLVNSFMKGSLNSRLRRLWILVAGRVLRKEVIPRWCFQDQVVIKMMCSGLRNRLLLSGDQRPLAYLCGATNTSISLDWDKLASIASTAYLHEL